MMIEEKTEPDAGLRRLVRANVLNVVFEVIVPMALFYGLRAAGVSQWWALMAGVLVAAPYVLWTVARNRKIDLIALVTLSVLALSVSRRSSAAPRVRRRGRPGGTPTPGSGAACGSTRPPGVACWWSAR